MFESGIVIAIFGAALCALLGCCGSALGVMYAGKAAAGVVSENGSSYIAIQGSDTAPQGEFGSEGYFDWEKFKACGIYSQKVW